MARRFLALAGAAVLLSAGFCAAAEPPASSLPPLSSAPSSPAGIEFFETHIRPVLVDNCFRCHSAAAPKLKAKLFLDSREGILKGGESDLPAIVPGNLEDSTLIRAIRYEDDGLQMPPKKKLAAEQIAAFETWVKMGAPYPASKMPATPASPHPHAMTLAEGRNFWSFKKPIEPAVPDVKGSSWAHNAIDRFVLAKMQAKGLTPSPPADKRTLIRRATYDLIGLPPTPAEIAAFESDSSPNAFAKVIDRLLASPHYGERWGRYWLDVARYADTKGYVFNEDRNYPFAYTYRDWVVRAFNEDLPYDQFLIQQIAADKLDLTKDNRPLAALGFLTVGRRFINVQPDIIDDRIDVVCRGTMGLTVGCARCHDHKYDPIPTADYYSLYGVFASTIESPDPPKLFGGPSTPAAIEFEKLYSAAEKKLDDFRHARFDAIHNELKTPQSIARYLSAVAQAGDADIDKLKNLLQQRSLNGFMFARWKGYLRRASAASAINAAWSRYSSLHPKPMSMPISMVNPAFAKAPVAPLIIGFDDADKLFTKADREEIRKLKSAMDALVATHPGAPPHAMAVQDAPTPITPVIFMRGNPGNPGKAVPRQFLSILSPDDRQPFKDGSGRLELARDIASKDNPLTARVFVNRVWMHHFGAGIVRTPSEFGARGELPTHPELLDWLALRFENDDGWSVKKLQKEIMMSAAYQQASLDRPDERAIDPENRLVWKMNRQRLDFESMRDSLLMAAGQLDLSIGGRAVDIFAEPFSDRRSLYGFIDRQNLPGTFRTFDFASPDATSAQRFTTSVPQQALYMMNGPFVIEQARKLVTRPAIAHESDPTKRITALYETVLDRAPDAQEIKLGTAFIENEKSQPKETIAASPWAYGTGDFDESAQRLTTFTPMPAFVDESWRGSRQIPDPKLGWAMLFASGGHPGDAHHAVVRRWTAPRDCTVIVDGTLSHAATQGDGVRARLVTSREGVLASWRVHHRSAQTRMDQIALKAGDTIDFIIDCGPAGDFSFDAFSWNVAISREPTENAVAGDDASGSWNSVADFHGPQAPMNSLSPWEKYAQVLLESNEFAFVD